ncbi:MAG TPA: PhzF family phenazine biosynthesis protein [Thermoanaerobaculia bacterium]|nr:PhzF family phenazine biosynthesis protein [Thermoanaerobaculia bacterium]
MPQMLIVDAFTAEPFAGNPAAVCFLDSPRPDDWLARVAREMNLSETAFLLSEGDHWRLRWFTPAVEVALCGHATLASAHALWQTGRLEPGQSAEFETKSGRLRALPQGEEIELDFPSTPPTATEPPKGLVDALGLEAPPVWVGRYREDYLLELASEVEVLRARPDFHALTTTAPTTRGVAITARAERHGADFVSRFFAPGAGVNEDPVTGSAHCALAPYWADRLGKNPLSAFQASARGGWLKVRVGGERVYLAGRAVTVVSGELHA